MSELIQFKDEEENASAVSDSVSDTDSNQFEGALESFRKNVKKFWPGSGVSSDTVDDLEAALLKSDVSMNTVEKLLNPLRDNPDIENGREFMNKKVLEIFNSAGNPWFERSRTGPTVYFFIGVNGSGKTTSIAKVAHQLKQNHKVLLAAGDTFRAAAIDQLQRWANKLDLEMISHEKGGDPSAVLYDACEAALNRNADFLLVDTAGRLHTRSDLVEQLSKMIEVSEKKIEGAPHESLLVLDASTGQNGLRQVKTFADKLPVTGLVLTKMDSTARGGIALTVADRLEIPVKLVGTGETLTDLVPFQPDVYCESLLEQSDSRTNS